MDISHFKWVLAVDRDRMPMLVCDPALPKGERFPFRLLVWAGTLSKWNGEIVDTEEGETIDYSEDDLFALMEKMQKETIRQFEG